MRLTYKINIQVKTSEFVPQVTNLVESLNTAMQGFGYSPPRIELTTNIPGEITSDRLLEESEMQKIVQLMEEKAKKKWPSAIVSMTLPTEEAGNNK